MKTRGLSILGYNRALDDAEVRIGALEIALKDVADTVAFKNLYGISVETVAILDEVIKEGKS